MFILLYGLSFTNPLFAEQKKDAFFDDKDKQEQFQEKKENRKKIMVENITKEGIDKTREFYGEEETEHLEKFTGLPICVTVYKKDEGKYIQFIGVDFLARYSNTHLALLETYSGAADCGDYVEIERIKDDQWKLISKENVLFGIGTEKRGSYDLSVDNKNEGKIITSLKGKSERYGKHFDIDEESVIFFDSVGRKSIQEVFNEYLASSGLDKYVKIEKDKEGNLNISAKDLFIFETLLTSDEQINKKEQNIFVLTVNNADKEIRFKSLTPSGCIKNIELYLSENGSLSYAENF